jgi:lipopolysaccharide transport system ATP-binding protein
MSAAIKVENLSKAYQLGEIGTGTISRDIERWIAKVRGKEDPFLKIGEANDRAVKGTSDVVWSLKDINFEIQQGDAVGIIGRNGAGKSTLLKILSRVTSPTTGTIKARGRIASLLEVGTGFHPELSGRENIFLNGAILGMRKREIVRKFDEIVDFAGVDRYIDTPVKRYSSGMYVRLAFAVAAHLESEILIVDEVLAVGDAEFQKKCLGKMDEVSKSEGRTILFVSHNMGAIQTLCNKGILLNKGTIKCSGRIDEVLNEYIKIGSSYIQAYSSQDDLTKRIQILNASIVNKEGILTSDFALGEPVFVNFTIKNLSLEKDVRYNIAILDIFDRIITVDSLYVQPNQGYKSYRVALPSELLMPTRFKVTLTIDIPAIKLIEVMPESLNFEIINRNSKIGSRGDTDFGFLIPKFKWTEMDENNLNGINNHNEKKIPKTANK